MIPTVAWPSISLAIFGWMPRLSIRVAAVWRRSWKRSPGMPARSVAGRQTRFNCPYHMWTFGTDGALLSAPDFEAFHLDISRSRINLLKGKFQNRARTTIVLARIDIGGAPHRNPDDEEIACPHVHLFREGYGDRWAFPVPPEAFAASQAALRAGPASLVPLVGAP